MIVEGRTYRVKRGWRDAFIAFFETRAIPALRLAGMPGFGPLLDLENPESFVWLPAFSSLAGRGRPKSAFYDGPVWKDELEPVAMPMFHSYRPLNAVSDGFANFTGSKGPSV